MSNGEREGALFRRATELEAAMTYVLSGCVASDHHKHQIRLQFQAYNQGLLDEKKMSSAPDKTVDIYVWVTMVDEASEFRPRTEARATQ